MQNKSIIYCMAMAIEAVVNMSLPFQQMFMSFNYYFFMMAFLVACFFQ